MDITKLLQEHRTLLQARGYQLVAAAFPTIADSYWQALASEMKRGIAMNIPTCHFQLIAVQHTQEGEVQLRMFYRYIPASNDLQLYRLTASLHQTTRTFTLESTRQLPYWHTVAAQLHL